MPKKTDILFEFPAGHVFPHKDTYMWGVPEKKMLNAHQDCQRKISRELRLLFSPKYILQPISFKVNSSVKTKSKLFTTALCVEADAETFCDSQWASLVTELKAFLKSMFDEVKRISDRDTDAPLLIVIEENQVARVAFANNDLNENISFVDNKYAKAILEELVKIARCKIESSYRMDDKTYQLEKIAVEVFDSIEGKDCILTIYIGSVSRLPFIAGLEIASETTIFGSRRISVGYAPELHKKLGNIYTEEFAAKVRFSTLESNVANQTTKIKLNRIEEVIEVMPGQQEFQADLELFEGLRET